jgi:hypothetical protein
MARYDRKRGNVESKIKGNVESIDGIADEVTRGF